MERGKCLIRTSHIATKFGNTDNCLTDVQGIILKKSEYNKD